MKLFKSKNYLKRVYDFNEKRGLIKSGFDINRETKNLLEEVFELHINDKDRIKMLVERTMEEIEAVPEKYKIVKVNNMLDAFYDIIYFAIGGAVKLIHYFNIEIKRRLVMKIFNAGFLMVCDANDNKHNKKKDNKVTKQADWKAPEVPLTLEEYNSIKK